jgi:hypothetical protein
VEYLLKWAHYEENTSINRPHLTAPKNSTQKLNISNTNIFSVQCNTYTSVAIVYHTLIDLSAVEKSSDKTIY